MKCKYHISEKWEEFLLGWVVPLLAGIGIVGGLFAFIVFLCCVFGGYELSALFGG